VLFSRQLPNGSHDFFQTFSIFFLDYFIKNPQTTIAIPFLTHNISAIGGVTQNLKIVLICINCYNPGPIFFTVYVCSPQNLTTVGLLHSKAKGGTKLIFGEYSKLLYLCAYYLLRVLLSYYVLPASALG
jgi:hypothetical protein